ncbi:GNAT family N-acetyltransferase [Halolamina salina]
MADVTIREAGVDDVDAAALADAYRDAYAANRELGFPAKAGSATPEQVIEWLREHRVFVAETEGEVVGGVRLERADAGTRKLSRLGVRERWKGEGIGSRLLERAERAARNAGAGTMRLTTPGEHPFLPEFYYAHGYEIVDDYPLDFPDYDEVVMEKSLD